MAITDIDWGTVTLTNGSTTVTGSGTSWIADDIRDGDTFVFVDGGDGFQQPIVASVQSNTELTLRNEWEGPTLTATAYTLRYQWDSSRVSAMSRRLIMLLESGNLEALAGLTGPGVAVFNGPHSMEVRPFTDFVNGVRFDVQVDTLADRDAYDGQVEGFTVLVSDMGDGRSAIFTKNSNTVADWSDAAYITGPVGPASVIQATVTELPPGSTASVTSTPITGGTRFDFNLPQASGFYNAGTYNLANAYDRDDVVRHNGSSFIALQSVPTGTSPSSAFPPVDTAYWQVLAAKGADGLGTGDVVGPSGAIADRIAVFDGTTGKLIKDSGVTVSELVPADGSITNEKLANVPTATIKGRVTAGTGDPEDLNVSQVRSMIGAWPGLSKVTNKFSEDVSFAYSTAGSIVFITNRIDNGNGLGRWYGREAIQISATSAAQSAFVQPRQPFMVAPTKKHRFDFFTSSYGPAPNVNYMVRVNCYNHWGDYLGKVDINLQAPNTPTTASYQRAVINEVGGSSPALLAGTEMILPQIGSEGNSEEQGVFMFMMSCIAEDEYPGTMASTAQASIGTHEAATDGDHLYVISHGFNQVIKYDLNLKRVASLDVGSYPHDCTILNGALWIANYGAANVQKVDLSTFTLTATYPIPDTRAGFGIANDGETLFVGAGMGTGASRLYRMNPDTGVMTEISSDLATDGANLPIRIMDGSAWIAREDTGAVNRVNPLTGALQVSVDCSVVGTIYGLGSGDGRVFVNGNRGVAVIDASTNTVTQVHMYRTIWRGESNVEVRDGLAYAVAGNGVMVIDYVRNQMREIELPPAEGKWARALPDGSVVIGSYAAPWLNTLDF